ncbi:unnamed protein product [Cyprideis torosa]|uniref:Uncharacterized protein n=1 Tax=Cyprideis torosa TaxID=163714 RepID=A0A7R8WBD8_9CRUS|nr:unnamed protein product [Cyprideis torosa]CAG0889474.1 unnamed protein product [Cyprideis torosa]
MPADEAFFCEQHFNPSDLSRFQRKTTLRRGTVPLDVIDDNVIQSLSADAFFGLMSALAGCTFRKLFFVTSPARASLLFQKVACLLEQSQVENQETSFFVFSDLTEDAKRAALAAIFASDQLTDNPTWRKYLRRLRNAFGSLFHDVMSGLDEKTFYLRQQWAAFCGIQTCELRKKDRLCSLHFAEEDVFLDRGRQLTGLPPLLRLRSGSVPCLPSVIDRICCLPPTPVLKSKVMDEFKPFVDSVDVAGCADSDDLVQPDDVVQSTDEGVMYLSSRKGSVSRRVSSKPIAKKRGRKPLLGVALTAKERKERWKKRMAEDKEKREEYLRKRRMKEKYVSVKELTAEEQRKRRDSWRKNKRSSRLQEGRPPLDPYAGWCRGRTLAVLHFFQIPSQNKYT